jgi:tripartite-type tricarboxylate transporter receptor subunit TctC
MNSWVGIVAPAESRRDIVSRVNSEMNTILKTPEAQRFFEKSDTVPAGGTPEQLGERIRKEVVLWQKILGAPK